MGELSNICCVCQKALLGTKYFCTKCWWEHGEKRPRPKWVKFEIASEKQRRRRNKRDLEVLHDDAYE